MNTELTLYSGTVTANGDTKTNPIGVRQFKGGLFFIKCSAITGGSLAVKVITYDPATDDWYDLVDFTAITATGKEMKVQNADIGTRIALVWTYAGTSVTFKVGACLKDI